MVGQLTLQTFPNRPVVPLCQDMANWTVAVYRRIEPLVQLLRQQIRSGPVAGIDETTVQVMDELGRANTSKLYIYEKSQVI